MVIEWVVGITMLFGSYISDGNFAANYIGSVDAPVISGQKVPMGGGLMDGTVLP